MLIYVDTLMLLAVDFEGVEREELAGQSRASAFHAITNGCRPQRAQTIPHREPYQRRRLPTPPFVNSISPKGQQ